MPPNYDDIYAQLITALHPSSPVALEIEILPSSFTPELLLDGPATGVPKSLLVPLFLKARQTFFNHLSSPNNDDGADGSYRPALQATALILLFDPNHITAANFRKRHIQRFFFTRQLGDGDSYHDGLEDSAEELARKAVRQELSFLESLITSPLGKHAKSSTLWAQRLWIVRNCFLMQEEGMGVVVVREEHAVDSGKSDSQMMSARHGVRVLWEQELAIVMKAGERHARNYHAWQYARDIFSLAWSQCSEIVEEGRRQCDGERLRHGIALVRKWCLMHPRDISGLAFLLFLLIQLRNAGCEGGNQDEAEKEARTCVLQIQNVARNFDWKGESIEWFLNTTRPLKYDDE